eukprot:TRINITY_DN13101_c0_g2_i1.p1 TRINITY_DN13101_c0_g2~~TRINITY_DN13101_c0_g2_i1.p1  ORF type:complete len:917 (-),score=80.12 TRINITY_DN13101_c0_g2_i1:52-2802(-)
MGALVHTNCQLSSLVRPSRAHSSDLKSLRHWRPQWNAICVGFFLASRGRVVYSALLDVQAEASIFHPLHVDQAKEPIIMGVEGVVSLGESTRASKSNKELMRAPPLAASSPRQHIQTVYAANERSMATVWTEAVSWPIVDTGIGSSLGNGTVHGQLNTDPDIPTETTQRPRNHNAGTSSGKHRHHHKRTVKHITELNKDSLWYLMAACTLAIAMLCVHMESLTKQASANGNGVESQFGSWRQIWKFVICAVGLNVSMLFWGIAQEFMMTNIYTDDDGNEEKLTISMSLVISNRMMTVSVCGVLLLLQGYRLTLPPYEVSMPAGTNLLASWFQYQSLAYVSFPLQTVTKSAKLLPVMIISSLRGKSHTSLEYAEAFLIVSSVVVFGFEVERASFSSDSSFTELGLLLLFCLLVFDSITPHLQDAICSGPDQLSPLEITFYMAFFATCLGFIQLLCSGTLLPGISFFLRHRHAILHLVVLSLCSTTTQFLISYTIKNFGPVAFSIIATTRQIISVMVSSILFKHELSGVAWFAAALVFSVLLWRAVRPKPYNNDSNGREVDEPQSTTGSPVVDALTTRSLEMAFFMCVVGMHMPMLFYSVVQEFLATHVFDGERFHYPLLLVAMNRVGGTLFACLVCKAQGIVVFDSGLLITLIPAGVNLFGTFCQYQALYYVIYPAHVLMKSIKMIPVMLAGQLLRNRAYTWSDYTEAAMITGVVCFFIWNYSAEIGQTGTLGTPAGITLMLLYVVVDSFTSNVEDMIYQLRRLDPAQLLLGMQFTSGIIAWVWFWGSGQFVGAVGFLSRHTSAIIHVLVLVLAETCGSYACLLTVKLFGPAVFTLLLMAHQIESFIVSVYLFNHNVQNMSCVCGAIVWLLFMNYSIRRATGQGMRLGSFDGGDKPRLSAKGSLHPPEGEEPPKSAS